MTTVDVSDGVIAALRTGRTAEAEQLCRRALAAAPDDPDFLLLLGLALQRQGRVRDALVPFQRLTELRPEDAMHWANYATALRIAGDADAARAAVGQAGRFAGDDPDRLEQVGVLRLQLDQPREAQAALMRASELSPDSKASIRMHAARACIACHDHRADQLLRPWRTWLPLTPELQAELAELLVQTSEPWDAMELLEDLLQRTPTDWASQLLLAKVYERVNQLDAAESKLRWIAAMVASAPEAPGITYEILSQRARLAMRRREYGEARRLLEQVGPGYSEDDSHWFALAKACDRLGDAQATMAALAKAHALQLQDLAASNPDLLEPEAPLLPGVDDRVTASDYAAWPALRAPDAAQSPVFVVGFPRSGTTLLEQMLDAHPALQSMDERPFLNILASQLQDVDVEVPQDLGRLNQRDCDELRKGYVLLGCEKIKRRWDARLVDKNPLNMLWLPMIHRLFPGAKFILALRHPCDVVWSCYLQNFRAAPLISACRSLPHLASAYVAAMHNWLDHVAVFHPDVLVSRYEELVADPAAQTARIAAFLGLADSEPMLHYDERAREKGYIRTPSYTQVVEPISTRSVGHWQQYRQYFDESLPVLQPMLQRWGYGVERADGAGA